MPRRKDPDALAAQIGERIRALREEHGLTMEKLAYESERTLSKGHLSSLERGLVMPTVETLEKIGDHLGESVVDLVNDPSLDARSELIELTRKLTDEHIAQLLELARKLSGP